MIWWWINCAILIIRWTPPLALWDCSTLVDHQTSTHSAHDLQYRCLRGKIFTSEMNVWWCVRRTVFSPLCWKWINRLSPNEAHHSPALRVRRRLYLGQQPAHGWLPRLPPPVCPAVWLTRGVRHSAAKACVYVSVCKHGRGKQILNNACLSHEKKGTNQSGSWARDYFWM